MKIPRERIREEEGLLSETIEATNATLSVS
jgi:hypothetical protein